MHGTPRPVAPETLLSQREWVRRVARALVADVHTAEDLEQDLWVEVLERPPRPRSSLRGWLAAALRHRLFNLRRSEARRARRERAVPRREPAPPVERVVAEAEAQRRVVDAVLDLAEPYRTALLLRFLEDLPPSGVAARLGVPVETVRTRVRRALALMRDRLDGRTAGGRAAWALALSPLLRPTDLAPAAGPALAGTGGLAGGLVMTQKAIGLAAALAAAGAGVGWWAGSRAEPGGSATAALAAEVALLRTGSEEQARRIARLERAPVQEERFGILHGAQEEQSARVARVERAVASAEGHSARIARLEEALAARAAPVPEDPAARGRRALEELKAIRDPERLVALDEAVRELVKIGDPVVPLIVAELDSGLETRYHPAGSGMGLSAGKVRYGSLRMTLIDALRQIGTPTARKEVFGAVERSRRITDYRDLIVPYRGTADPEIVAGISALVPDALACIAESGLGAGDLDLLQLGRSLAWWIESHGMSETAGPLEAVVRKAVPGRDGWSPIALEFFRLLVEFDPERAVQAVLDLQQRHQGLAADRQPVLAFAWPLPGKVPLSRAARYYALLLPRGDLAPETRLALYGAMPWMLHPGIEDPDRRIEDAAPYVSLLEERLRVESDPAAKTRIEWLLSQVRGAPGGK